MTFEDNNSPLLFVEDVSWVELESVTVNKNGVRLSQPLIGKAKGINLSNITSLYRK